MQGMNEHEEEERDRLLRECARAEAGAEVAEKAKDAEAALFLRQRAAQLRSQAAAVGVAPRYSDRELKRQATMEQRYGPDWAKNWRAGVAAALGPEGRRESARRAGIASAPGKRPEHQRRAGQAAMKKLREQAARGAALGEGETP